MVDNTRYISGPFLVFDFQALWRSGLSARQSARNSKTNKKLSYRRWTARRAILVNYAMFYAMRGGRKVSNSKSDIQGHSRALAMVPFDRPHTISY